MGRGRDQSRTMLPEINLQGDVDVAALSPLLRGMLLSVAYADGEGGIGLTATGAMNLKFVHWAAVHFLWPGFTAEDLYSMNKVLNESDMPPSRKRKSERGYAGGACSSIFSISKSEKVARQSTL